MYLYFDNENEYVYVEKKSTPYPLGTAFIDFIQYDFLNRDFENSPITEENPLLRLVNSIYKIRTDNRELKNIVSEYIKATDVVLNIDNDEFNQLDTLARFYIYHNHMKHSYDNISIKSHYSVNQEFGDIIDINDKKYKDLTLKELTLLHKDNKYMLAETHYVETIAQALYVSFIKMVSNKIKVKKCKCCGKYFIPQGRIDTEYCNRLAPNSNKHCSEIGATKKYHTKSANNPIKKAFQKEYKKTYARIRLKKILPNEFNNWSINARKLRELAIKEDWDINKFTNSLKDMEVITKDVSQKS